MLAALLAPCRAASLYRTRPVSDIPQPDFLNTVLVGSTELEPRELLELCLALERLAGRRRAARNGPRVLDIDVLLYGGRVIAEPGLTVPHPRLRERRFVLAPLAEVAPAMRVPPDGTTAAALLAAVGQDADVVRLGPVC